MAAEEIFVPLHAHQIRILHLEPLFNSKHLQGRLETIDLQEAEGRFVAVSWTWGTAESLEESTMLLNGQQFPIRARLEQLLHDVQPHLERKPLWIDSLCVNQEDPREQNMQIALMANVYASAHEVYVWLGTANIESEFAMDILRQGADYETTGVTGLQFGIGVFDLMMRPWWTRTWIVQEFVLNVRPPRLFCGPGPSIAAPLLFAAWRRVLMPSGVQGDLLGERRKPVLAQALPRYLLEHLRASRHGTEFLTPNLRNALMWLRSFEATMPCDKVYGTLGLLAPQWRDQFVRDPGIHSEHSPAQIYYDTTVYLLQYEQNRTFFFDFPIGIRRDGSSPSWVPNFNLDATKRTVVRLGDVTGTHLDVAPEPVVIEQHATLLTRGIVIDQVDEFVLVGDDRSMSSASGNSSALLLGFTQLLHHIHALVAKTSLYEPLWRTLVAGCYGSLRNEHLEDRSGCDARFTEWMALPADGTDAQTAAISHRPHIMTSIEHTLVSGRAFFVGKGSSYGLCEAAMEEGTGIQKGDVVALLFPTHFIPFILRRQGDTYQMVGPAYFPDPLRASLIQRSEVDPDLLEEVRIV